MPQMGDKLDFILFALLHSHLYPLTCSPVFAHYAETCFREFGDRVKTWITMNEPHEFVLDHGTLGCKDSTHSCSDENPKDAPYRMGHNVILSHAAAYQLYQSKYMVS